jgi:hypothetical protein
MMRIITFFLGVLVFCLFATQGHAQTAKWALGYPKQGTAAGTILIKGTSSAGTGWSLAGTASVTVWPKGGGVITIKPITVNKTSGVWGEVAIGGLTSGTQYNIIVGVFQDKNMATQTIATDPEVAPAK